MNILITQNLDFKIVSIFATFAYTLPPEVLRSASLKIKKVFEETRLPHKANNFNVTKSTL